MAFKPMMMKPQHEPVSSMVKIEKWAGVNELATASQIANNEWPESMNVALDELGAVEKRYGYQQCLPVSLGSSPINGFIFFNNKLFVAQATYLYEFNMDELN
jgi:hypothetical protein